LSALDRVFDGFDADAHCSMAGPPGPLDDGVGWRDVGLRFRKSFPSFDFAI
jgi:hypothetical protein